MATRSEHRRSTGTPGGSASNALPAGLTRARALFLVAAFLSFVLSVVVYFGGNESDGIFVGLWVPSILALGAFIAPRNGGGR